MKASGNGDVNVCVANLLRTFRGEVPYERVKGLDPRLIDRPSRDAEIEVQQDATWLIEAYEPRAIVNGITMTADEAAAGGFVVQADITEREE